MKNIIKQLNIFAVLVVLFIPVLVNASDYDSYYTDDYSYSGYYTDNYSYSNYDYYTDNYSYDNYNYYTDDYNYSNYDYYADDYSYSNYDYYVDDYSYSNYDYYVDDYSYSNYDYYIDDYSYGNYDYYVDDYSYVGNSYDYPDYSNYGYTYDDFDYYDYGYDSYDYGNYSGGCSGGCSGGGYYYDREIVVINDNDDLDVVCRVSDTRVDEDDRVTFTADVSGGRGTISYDWSGDINSSSQSVRRQFNSEGDYEVEITVRDSRGNRATDDCTVIVEEDDRNDDFDVVCRISDTSIEEGDRVRIEVDIDGGDSPFDIEWDGDIDDVDDFDDNDRSQYVRFDDRGTYDFEVTVEDDDGRKRSDDCTVRVSDDDDDDGIFVNRVFDYPTGNFSSVDSVFLNQVPYTGPAETFKLVGFIGLVLLWSFAGAFMIRKKMNKVQTSNKVKAFKEANRNA
jgi:hypothetical protein